MVILTTVINNHLSDIARNSRLLLVAYWNYLNPETIEDKGLVFYKNVYESYSDVVKIF
ncbi:hypothetical protein J4233_00975 [Candidatus Pacearchaeota archaeon]|nr:hypothetical protein [Candidatus Pacearchaeota archaeon]